MDKLKLENLIAQNKTQSEIADELNVSKGCIIYWLKKFGLKTNAAKSRKSSVVWMTPKEEFEILIKTSNSLAEVLRKLGYNNHLNSALYNPLKKRIREENIDISHINLGRDSNKGRSFKNTFPRYTKETFIESLKNKKRLSSSDKKKIIEFNVIPHEKCSICGQKREWNGKKLTLQLDHIDGDSSNNDPSNLRFICPNCHSQTETFCIGNKKIKEKNRCIDCGKTIARKSLRCQKCANEEKKNKENKNILIKKEDLKKIIWEKPATEIAKIYNINSRTVKNYCINYNLDSPPRGYWNKRKSGISHEDALNPPLKIVDPKFKKGILDDNKVLEIYELLKKDVPLREIARRYDRTHPTITKIRDKKGGYGEILKKYNKY